MNKFSHHIRILCSSAILLLITACSPDQHPALDYTIKGIDVSRYQAQIDWAKVTANGLDFAFVKATEGGDHQDVFFLENWAALRHRGLRRGAYHFFRPETPARAQALNFFTQVGSLQVGDLPPVLDVELRGTLAHTDLIAEIKEWLLLAEARYGVKPIIYSGQMFYNRYLAGHFAEYPLWIARYHDAEPVLADGRNFQFWQYGDQGVVPGITGPVDLNVFQGDYLDLANLSVTSPNTTSLPSPTVLAQ